jgi:hypothetical protein
MKTKSHSDHKQSSKPEFSLVIGDKTLSSFIIMVITGLALCSANWRAF